VNVFENVTTVQFDHRLMADVVTGLTLWQALSLIWIVSTGRGATSATVLAAAVLCQVGLGIWALLWAVPLWLGLAHQAGAAIVFALAVRHWHVVTRPPA
jgi:cytochrome c oxidase assembly protein subunit 15